MQFTTYVELLTISMLYTQCLLTSSGLGNEANTMLYIILVWTYLSVVVLLVEGLSVVVLLVVVLLVVLLYVVMLWVEGL